jgi:hypothetical protein
MLAVIAPVGAILTLCAHTAATKPVAWAKLVGTNVDLALRKENSGTRGLREIDSWFEGNRLVV